MRRRALVLLLVAATLTPRAGFAEEALEEALSLQAAGRCAEAEPILAAYPGSARAAYFLGVCRLGREDFAGAVEAFELAATFPGWEATSVLMRGIARLRAGDISGARLDLQRSVNEGRLTDDLRSIARDLLPATTTRRLHGAVHLGVEGDSNALQAPAINLPGLDVVASPALTATALAVWTPLDGLRLRATLLRREVTEAPLASVGAALLSADWTSSTGEGLALTATGDVGGYVLGWDPFFAAVQGRAGLRWSGGGWRLSAEGRARGKEFQETFAALSGGELGAVMRLERKLGRLRLGADLDHTSDRTRSPDFARDAQTAALEGRLALGWGTLRVRGAAGHHQYRNVNSLRGRDGLRSARQDLRTEATAGLEVPWRAYLFALDGTFARNHSNIEAFDFARSVARLGVTRAF